MINLTEDEITKNWKDENILVSINTLTYNHEKYIAQCIEGILMQKTNFAFELLIHDDASTDNTVAIIKEYEKKYPNIIKPIYQTENQWSKGIKNSATYQYPRANGKYIAICEGDDYWIDENKLQMQVDFLENNPEYGMCYCKVKQYNQTSRKFYRKKFGSLIKNFEDIFINGNRIPTLSVVFKKDLLSLYQHEIEITKKKLLMGDLPMWLFFFRVSNVKFINRTIGVYRILKESASHSSSKIKNQLFLQCSLDIRIYFAKKYNCEFLIPKYLVMEKFNNAIENHKYDEIYKLTKQIPFQYLSKKKIIYIIISFILNIKFRFI